MKTRNFSVGLAGALALGALFSTGAAMAQTTPPTQGPAANGSPAWFMQGSFPDPGGRTIVAPDGTVTVPPRPAGGRGGAAALTPCTSDIGKYCGGMAGAGARACLSQNSDKLSGECKTALAALPFTAGTPGCSHSTICGRRGGKERGQMQRVEWKPNLGYTFTYPIVLPPGEGGVPAVALDSKGNLWVFQRKAAGMPQLFKFDPNHKMILQVGDDVIGHQDKAHGMAVDADDNVWICDAGSATVMKLSPEGKLLMTIGVRGHRGDWDEAKGQRLLWQPVMLAFAKNGDVYIAEGHANESPNDVDSDDPTNNIGAARIIHLDRNGKFIGQWFGDEVNQGKFDSTHGFAIDPKNGNVWIGDREQYRIVVYTANGEFLRTMQTRNLVCAIEFDAQGNPWMGSGQDGQYLKLTQDGKVVGAVGGGMGIGKGQFTEASYFVFDKQNNIYAGDTSVGRVTVMLAPKKK
jgi:DNA-binding beta-propeller fold protein YncE